MTSWHSYPKIYNLGHAALKELFVGDIVIEEKIDGSQFSFGRFGEDLRVRSRGQEMRIDHPEKMFTKIVDWVKENASNLHDGWTYRGEYLAGPKHNTLAYDRHPKNYFILFDVNTAEEEYLSPGFKMTEADRLGLECVPMYAIGDGQIVNVDMIHSYLERTSVLGGAKVEGVVIKNYSRFGPDKKVLMGKHVSEAFKEIHRGEWKEKNPSGIDIISQLKQSYTTPARWMKAVQHLKEAGKLTTSPKDIGPLIAEVIKDVQAECEEEVKKKLFEWAWPNVRRGLTYGLPEWYKEQLLHLQFEETPCPTINSPQAPDLAGSSSLPPQELAIEGTPTLL